MNKNLRCLYFLVILTLEVCHSTGRKLPDKILAQTQELQANQPNKSDVTSYFEQEPYGPNTYAFGYEVNDKRTANVQFRDERRYTNGSVEGSYGYLRPDARITVTHYLFDAERGYLSQTETFQAGEERHIWQPHWPLPKSSTEKTKEQTTEQESRILSKDKLLPDNVAKVVKQQNGVDINKLGMAQNVINPTVLGIINGTIPVQNETGISNNNNESLGFKTMDTFLPTDFPIKPFQLPNSNEVDEIKEPKAAGKEENLQKTKLKPANEESDKTKLKNKQDGEEKKTEVRMKNVTNSTLKNTENKGKTAISDSNKVTSALPNSVEAKNVEKSVEAPTVPSQFESNDGDRIGSSERTAAADAAWYEKIIKDTRKDFLNGLPN